MTSRHLPGGLPLDAVEKIRGVFRTYPTVERVVLYGSRAKGNYREGSDIDLTVEGAVPERLLSKIDCELDDLLLPYKVDLSLRSQIRNRELLAHIDRVGTVFYERTHQVDAAGSAVE